MRRILEVAGALRERPGATARAALLSFGVQAAFVGLNAWIGAAVGIELPFAAWCVAWPLAKLAALVPISLGGLGLREAALAALLAPFGVEATLAVAQGLVWQSVLMATGLAGGALAWASTARAVDEPAA